MENTDSEHKLKIVLLIISHILNNSVYFILIKDMNFQLNRLGF
jgi:hypothetical protein